MSSVFDINATSDRLVPASTMETKFVFTYPSWTIKFDYKLEVPIYVPFSGTAEELGERLMAFFNLPSNAEEDLTAALKMFLEEKTQMFFDKMGDKVVTVAKEGDTDVEDVIKTWEKSFKTETVEYSEPEGATDEELFSAVYHKLVHSPALEPILQVEHSYALAVHELTLQREEQVEGLTTMQTEEMAQAIEGVPFPNTEHQINEMAASHFEEQNLLQGKWNSEIDTLKEDQRKEYRDWLMKMLEDNQTNVNAPSIVNTPRTFNKGAHEDKLPMPRLEESFTIHLGSQMKQMHNIRILSADVLDFCRVKLQSSGNLDPQPQRLQTALALYSSDLCGLVVLTDSHIGAFTGLTKELTGVCQQSTDFHFPSVEEQLEKIKEEVKEVVSWRNAHWSHDHLGTLTSTEQMSRRLGTKNLQTGDVYLTRHSNLAEVHVVFHMVVDDSLRSSDINSRHPVILGLRNILKTACSNDITTLTIPVLLMHEMTEEMTVAWCTKRAELVFKCVKGFMIEMASWGGSELKNLQFLVPKGISEEVFGTLATMLPSIFRVSNPLVFKVSSTPHTPKSS
ncbi:protein C12orf4 homolog isoform X1 [Schistocerca nitens]|uniref:protein C12orf4 homolog n=2 Tax=Schistocerca TaxID=7008 RepID=UPI002118F5FF|nr:protein C12orf4 homolog [Schistocerca cancellata]XP_049804699.1 protein C12orf4 homolog isoform X1 [Schistocerca nitens]